MCLASYLFLPFEKRQTELNNLIVNIQQVGDMVVQRSVLP